MKLSPLGRPLSVKPRRTGYVHRPFITVCDGLGVTEDGEVVRNLPLFATSSDPHIWVTYDVLSVAIPMRDAFSHTDWFTWDFSEARDLDTNTAWMSKARLTSFGFDKKTPNGHVSNQRRKQARHTVWDVPRMFSDPSIAAANLEDNHGALLEFAKDVRAWCRTHDLSLRGTLPGIASQLLRDRRFWPHDRGRVPTATNDAVRPFLPGVHQRRLAETQRRIPLAVGLDQRRAYHRVAQQIAAPDSTTLYARGFFTDPEHAPRPWAMPGSPLYERTAKQPGIVALKATARMARSNELRLPAVDRLKGRSGIVYIWTNELDYAIQQGLKVEHMVAAWTSLEADTGLPKYGAWAESEIDAASPQRAFWLKPTLHSAYGMLGARHRALIRYSRLGKGTPTAITIRGAVFPVNEGAPLVSAPPTTNVATLGVLQSEIRRRSLELGSDLARAGVNVLHVHADGLHVEAGPLPFPEAGWTAEPVTNLVYEDDVSWLSDERDVLPGRDTRVRVELRRHRARLLHHRAA